MARDVGAVGSQNHNGTGRWVKLAVETDASCRSSDARNTIDNHRGGITLILINNIIALEFATSSLPSVLQCYISC